jgi:nucleotide-binding universal stress UspA family protein
MGIFPTKILLATDGSEGATLAARTAADIATKTGTDLLLLVVPELPGIDGMASPLPRRFLLAGPGPPQAPEEGFQTAGASSTAPRPRRGYAHFTGVSSSV